jgi:hypothetical protein
MPKSVFVSYNHKDGDWVWNRLVPVLKAGGADVLIDLERFESGRALLGQMDATQDEAEVHVLVLSPQYLASDYCVHEMDRAIAMDPDFEHGSVIPVLRRDGTHPDSIRIPHPLYVNLKDDAKSKPWDLLLKACDADLGVAASDWLAARDELRRFLERQQSVNLVVRGSVTWRPLIEAVAESVPDLARVDLEDPRTASLRGLVREILRASGSVREVPTTNDEALVVLGETLQARKVTRLALLHFDRAAKRYDSDLFAALRYLFMEERKLVLLVQSHRPFVELIPPDDEISRIDIKTIELQARRRREAKPRRRREAKPRLILEELRVRDFKNVEDLKIDFRCPSSLAGNWTCVAGINGSGKTSVLQAVCLLLLGRRRVTELGEERLRQMLRRLGDERQPALLEATLREGDERHHLRLPLGPFGVDEERFGDDCDLAALTALWQRLGERLLVAYGATRRRGCRRRGSALL